MVKFAKGLPSKNRSVSFFKNISLFIKSHGIKPVEIETINKNQNNLDLMKQDNDNWEFESAKIFAKKKKLLENNESYEKKLAKMARAGFSYELCKQILNEY